MPTWLVSACLLGQRCRYDGAAAKPEAQDRARLRILDGDVVPFCPEEAGGLPTPRPAAAFLGGDGHDVLEGRAHVTTAEGDDVTEAFRLGAERAVETAARAGATHALLKARSPSCGVGCVHVYEGPPASDGRPAGQGTQLASGDGVTAAALKRAGLTVLAEEPSTAMGADEPVR